MLELRQAGTSALIEGVEGVWSTQTNADELRGAARIAGAFALLEDSRDAVIVTSLPSGSYTALVRGSNNTSGVALVEVYDLP